LLKPVGLVIEGCPQAGFNQIFVGKLDSVLLNLGFFLVKLLIALNELVQVALHVYGIQNGIRFSKFALIKVGFCLHQAIAVDLDFGKCFVQPKDVLLKLGLLGYCLDRLDRGAILENHWQPLYPIGC
jgi:hypothetical protein